MKSSDIERGAAERVANARAFVFDMDGTLILGNSVSEEYYALPGAVDLIARLHNLGIPLRIFANGTAKTSQDYAASRR